MEQVQTILPLDLPAHSHPSTPINTILIQPKCMVHFLTQEPQQLLIDHLLQQQIPESQINLSGL
jgi:hypothetical protein